MPQPKKNGGRRGEWKDLSLGIEQRTKRRPGSVVVEKQQSKPVNQELQNSKLGCSLAGRI
jgi:hypothetical protein